MIRTLTNYFLFAILIMLLGCESRVRSSMEAEHKARERMGAIVAKDGISESTMKEIHVIENKEIDGWEVYFENRDKSYRLNILVTRSGHVEPHRLKETPGENARKAQ